MFCQSPEHWEELRPSWRAVSESKRSKFNGSKTFLRQTNFSLWAIQRQMKIKLSNRFRSNIILHIKYQRLNFGGKKPTQIEHKRPRKARALWGQIAWYSIHIWSSLQGNSRDEPSWNACWEWKGAFIINLQGSRWKNCMLDTSSVGTWNYVVENRPLCIVERWSL